MGKLGAKYRHALVLLVKKLDRMIAESEKEKQKWVEGDYVLPYWKGHHRARIICLSDIRDDVMNILNHTREEK